MTAVFTDLDGVYSNGIHCGIKSKRKDLAYIYIPDAVACAGAFTQNKFVAAPIVYTRKLMKKTTVIKAIVINSGNANAGTGKQGSIDAKTMAQITASELGLRPSEVAVASTGLIGEMMPMDTIHTGLQSLLSHPHQKNAHAASEAILTTDLFPKLVYKKARIGRKDIVVAGMCKGSGMIAPNMGTMLAFIVTNASMTNERLSGFLSEAVSESFNMVSVDNDTSTNDMVLAFATGQKQFSFQQEEEVASFQDLLTEVCVDMAKLIAKDGEGATKVIEVSVNSAASRQDARHMAKAIVNSPLVKTAVHGSDPNWGRVLAAAGKVEGIKFNPDKVALFFNNVCVYSEGAPVLSDRQMLVDVMKQSDSFIRLDLNLGHGFATAWGCDLSKGYIDINTAYC